MEIKKQENRGGKRRNAGRKPVLRTVLRAAITQIKKATAADILSTVDEIKAWQAKLESEDERVSLQALMYLTDKRDGRAVQTVVNANASSNSAERLAEILARADAAVNGADGAGRASGNERVN